MEDKFGLAEDRTIAYYEKNADIFVNSTINADVNNLYKCFEKYLIPGCRILDLGCGSGRDSRYFAEKGYDVVAIDPSVAMCEKTKDIVNIPVYKMKAEDISFNSEFDAVWACASLLHVSRLNMKQTLCRVSNALKRGGVLYASWKYGDNERYENGRYFSDYIETDMKALIDDIIELSLIEMWTTEDVRQEKRLNSKWLNVLVRKV